MKTPFLSRGWVFSGLGGLFLYLFEPSGRAQSALLLQPRQLVFNAVSGEPCATVQEVRVIAQHGGPLTWTVTEKSGWISVSGTSGTTPSAPQVRVDPAGFAPGIYEGTLNLGAPEAIDSPQNVGVSLIVNPLGRVRLTRWKLGRAGACSFSVDDSLPAGFELLEKKDLGGTYFLNGSAAAEYFTGFYEAGMEYGCHLLVHNCLGKDEATLRGLIEPNYAGICGSTPQPPEQLITLAWPCGTTSGPEQAWASDYFLAARGYNLNQLEEATPSNFLNLKSFNSHEHPPYPPADLKGVLDAAESLGKWANLVFHPQLNDDGAAAYTAKKDLWVAPIGRVIKYIVQRDRTIISDYIESASSLEFQLRRLAVEPTPKRDFEAAFTPEDSLTLEIDVTGWAGVSGVYRDQVPQAYVVRERAGKRLLLFETVVGVAPQTVQVQASATTGPFLTLDRARLEFSGIQRGSDPMPQMVTIATTGTPTWRAEPSCSEADWLTVSPNTGTGSATLTVGCRLAGLTDGRYRGRITVSAPEGVNSRAQETIDVVLTVGPRGVVHYDFSYPDRESLLNDGWDFTARSANGLVRSTETTGARAISYGNLHPGTVRIPVDRGSLSGALNDSKNTLFRELPWNWTSVRLKADFMPTQALSQMGLLLYENDDNYVSVHRTMETPGFAPGWENQALGLVSTYSAHNVVGILQEKQQQAQPAPPALPLPATSFYLRADRNIAVPGQDLIQGFFSLDGMNWIALGTTTRTFSNPRLGIYVGTPSTVRAVETANLEWVEVVTAPPNPDWRTLTVTAATPENGVTIGVSSSDPAGPSSRVTGFTQPYPPGTEVTLTAPLITTGGTFKGWQKDGVDAGSRPSLTLNMDADHHLQVVYGPGALAPKNVPEAADYILVYSLDLPSQANFNLGPVPYEIDHHHSVGAFSRIGYYLELQPTNGLGQFVWASMDAFTADPARIGVPTQQTGAAFQRALAHLNVRSSVPGVFNGDDLAGGSIEFWPNNYGRPNTTSVPGASSTRYDWGDSLDPPIAGYGSMQVHHYGAGQTLLAFNGWGMGSPRICDLGIGKAPSGEPDWTFAQNASAYRTKKLQVYVLPIRRTLTVSSMNPNAGVPVSVSPADQDGVVALVTGSNLAYTDGSVVILIAPAAVGGNIFQNWQKDGSDAETSLSLAITMDADHVVTAVYAPPTPTFYTWKISSSNPSTGVTIGVSPLDHNGAGNGTTELTRTYAAGTVVTLTAPSALGGKAFLKWLQDGSEAGSSPTLSLTAEGDYTLTAVYGPGPLAPRNVPEAANYTLVYSLDLPTQAAYNTTGVPYEIDRRNSLESFSRVAYYLELQPSGGAAQYLWVSMDAFTTDPAKIGVPTQPSGASFQQAAANLNVRSSVAGIVTGDGLAGGNLEFWPNNYGSPNLANVPGASSTVYDWGDRVDQPVAGYGCMQVHNSAARQTLFAFNGWGVGTFSSCDLGIGHSSGQHPDWTFARNTATYSLKKLQVYVLPSVTGP